jgi:predicted ArsR family transcriptional regulator
MLARKPKARERRARLRVLIEHGDITIAAAARKLGCSRKQIERDLVMFEDEGFFCSEGSNGELSVVWRD